METSPESNPALVLKNNVVGSWGDLSLLIEHFSRFNGHDWLFRGDTSVHHALIPKIGRPERKKKPASNDPQRRIAYSQADELAVFEMFRDAARAHIAAVPTNDLEWLALAQHFRAPTRLLDWTEGFLVAAWFAVQTSGFVEIYDEKKRAFSLKRQDAAIWVIRALPRVNEDDLKKPFEVSGLKCYRPPHISPRIPAQRSVFTIQENPVEKLEHQELVQFKVRSEACFEIRKRLDACGVNQNSLFPDLEGLGLHVAWRYKNNWLAGYRSRGAP